MAMTGAVASQLIHHIILDRVQLGWLDQIAVRKLRIFVLNPYFAGPISTCWWVLCDTPTKHGVINLRVLSECVVKMYGLHFAIDTNPAASNAVATLYETFEELEERESNIGAIDTEMRGLWRSRVWSSIRDPELEFVLAMQKFKCGGAAHFTESADTIAVNLFYQPKLHDFNMHLGHYERQPENRQMEYTIRLCTPGPHTIQYLYEPRRNHLKSAAA